ncbi:MAG TPA: cupin domain-containing protein [Acidobacteriota bacterium]|jgi:quercetin dioxygenase-like cupin family protein
MASRLFSLASLLLATTTGLFLTRQAPVLGEKVVLENKRVRVIEYDLKPGVAMGMHSHPRDRVEITLTGGRVRVTTEDGKIQEAVEKDGNVVFQKGSAARHDVVNIGDTPLHAYHVELK